MLWAISFPPLGLDTFAATICPGKSEKSLTLETSRGNEQPRVRSFYGKT